MEEKKNIAFTPDPVTGTVHEKAEHLFDTKKVVHSKNDGAIVNGILKKISYTFSGKESRDANGNHVGFKCSASCKPKIAEGHNRRNKSWIEKLDNVDPDGHCEIWMDYRNLKTAYEEIFGEALEEYNKGIRSDRRIKDYLKHIQNDRRAGSMKKNAKVDNSRKPVYEFVFMIGKRDNRLDDETSIKILKEFCLERMPEKFPNIRPIGIYLHADEFTYDEETGEKLPSAVHVHFDYVPIAHALSDEEQKVETEWRKELEEIAKKEAEAKGEKFDRKRFNDQDWTTLRVKKFGKALQKGMKLQSSMTGACAEMGFRTKGKLTAQIQMEETVRMELADLCESYGIKIDREIDKNREEAVDIHKYKERERNKKVLKATQKALKEIEEKTKEDRRIQAQNQKDLKTIKKTARQNRMDEMKNASDRCANESRERELDEQAERQKDHQKEIDDIQKDRAENEHCKNELNETAKRQKLIEEQQKAKDLEQKKTEKSQNDRQNRLDKLHDEVFSQIKKNDDREADFEAREQKLSDERKQFESEKKDFQKEVEMDGRRKKEIQNLLDDYSKKKNEHRELQYTSQFVERIGWDIDRIEKDFHEDMKMNIKGFSECVKDFIGNTKKYVQSLVIKFEEKARIWNEYFNGKKIQDLKRTVADMESNGIEDFAEYDKRKRNGGLNWQKKAAEEEKQKVVSHKRERPSITWN